MYFLEKIFQTNFYLLQSSDLIPVMIKFDFIFMVDKSLFIEVSCQQNIILFRGDGRGGGGEGF